MKRRQILGLGVAAACLPGRATAAASWTLQAGPNRFDITLDGPRLACDCAFPGEPVHAPSREPWQDAIASIGPQRRPVAWRAVAEDRPNPVALALTLQAEDAPLGAEIGFEADPSGLVLCRRTTLRHDGAGPPVVLRTTLAGLFTVHAPVARIRYLDGGWAAETQIRHAEPGEAPLLLQSRTGKTGFGPQPWLALQAGGATCVSQLFCSGNWQMQVVPGEGGVAILGGLNWWRFRHVLAEGESLALPEMLFIRAEGGLDRATQALHDWRRLRRPDPDRPVPVQFNSWYPYFGEPSAATMLTLLPQARRLGCEAFVIDAGWHRTEGDDSDAGWDQRTGDWRTSRRRFPNGLAEIGAACRDQGLRFGLWFEPEVIAPAAVLRRDHPDWLHHPGGQPPAAAARALLNLGVPAAREAMRTRLARIIAAVGVGWMKWDCNSDLHEGGWAPGLPAALTRQDPLVAHYAGLTALQDALRREFPDLVLEMCASGGGRMDGGILSHAHLNWISDQPSPVRKLAIHFGSQSAHPAVVCNDWLVEWPPDAIAGYDDDAPELVGLGDLPFRLHVAMLGSFGISARVDRWEAADVATVAAHVGLYRERLRPLIQFGDQYLLTHAPGPDGSGDWAAVWYAAKDGTGGALYAFRLGGAEAVRVFGLPGLAAGARYRCSRFGDAGAALLTAASTTTGLAVRLKRRWRSALVLVERVQAEAGG